jgi:hypothetical protein
MTTLSTGTDQQGTGLRGLLGATALTLLVVGTAAVWLARPERSVPAAGQDGRGAVGGATAPAPQSDTPALTDGAGRYLSEQQVSATKASEGVTPMGGLAELYAEQQAAQAGARVTTNGVPELDGEPAGAPTRQTLIVTSPDELHDAYARLVEWFRALDGSIPLVVTVAAGGAAPAAAWDGASGACGTTIGPADC